MFECRLDNGTPIKKIITALKELVDHAAWDITEEGIMLQSMDSSHVALVQLNLIGDDFDNFRCEDVYRLGINMDNLKKIFTAYTMGDAVHINCQGGPDADSVSFVFQDSKNLKSQRYELRLMDLDIEQLGIPEQEYSASFTMLSSEFTRIIKDMLIVGESVTIGVTKGDVTFRTEGELGKAHVTIACDEGLDSVPKKKKSKKKKSKKESKKKDETKTKVKKEIGDTDDEMNSTLASEEEQDEEIDDETDDEKHEPKLFLDVKEGLELSFATQYLKKFTAAGPLSKYVMVSMSEDVPMVITYDIDGLGHLKYFLAPKIEDDDDDYD